MNHTNSNVAIKKIIDHNLRLLFLLCLNYLYISLCLRDLYIANINAMCVCSCNYLKIRMRHYVSSWPSCFYGSPEQTIQTQTCPTRFTRYYFSWLQSATAKSQLKTAKSLETFCLKE